MFSSLIPLSLVISGAFSLLRLHDKQLFENKYGCWPRNIIPYTIGDGFSEEQKTYIVKQIHQVNSQTCVKWYSREEKSIDVRKYVEFVYLPDSPCMTKEELISADILVVYIRLKDSCFTNKWVMHEMMHAMGFDHEHQRKDRSCYVDVDQIKITEEGNREKYEIISDSLFSTWPYDKFSVMHYRNDSIMQSRKPGEPLGNGLDLLSWYDLHKIRYRFCGAPSFCKTYTAYCKEVVLYTSTQGCIQ